MLPPTCRRVHNRPFSGSDKVFQPDTVQFNSFALLNCSTAGEGHPMPVKEVPAVAGVQLGSNWPEEAKRPSLHCVEAGRHQTMTTRRLTRNQ
jgi:hypothetical protein